MGNRSFLERACPGARGLGVGVVAFAVVWLASGCTTIAEHRKLEARVIDLERGGGGQRTGLREEVADYVAELDSLQAEVRDLQGRLEVTEKRVVEAVHDARKARSEIAAARQRWGEGGAVADGTDGEGGGAPASTDPADADGAGFGLEGEALSEEIRAYRDAYASWRSGENQVCIDQFRKFLQTYPASSYADDAAYWMADCHFRQADFKNAALRFDDVVRNYPSGNKAPDALFRQGESLQKLGYHEAAKRAFERVVKEYPDSPRAPEAKRQLAANSSG